MVTLLPTREVRATAVECSRMAMVNTGNGYWRKLRNAKPEITTRVPGIMEEGRTGGLRILQLDTFIRYVLMTLFLTLYLVLLLYTATSITAGVVPVVHLRTPCCTWYAV